MDTRTIAGYVLLVISVFAGVALVVWGFLELTKIGPVPSDASLTDKLNVYKDVVKPAPLVCPTDNLLTDYIVAGSGNSILPGNTAYTHVTADSITKVIEGGARIVELAVYDVKGEPVVGLANNANLMLTYNTVPFEACCIAVANAAFKIPSPFILSLAFNTDNTVVLNKCAETLKVTLRKFMLDSSYSYQRKNLAIEPVCNLLNKLIIVSGDHHKGNGMDELVNLSWSTTMCRRLTYTQASQTYDHDELITYNRRHITLVVPDVDTASLVNKSPELPLAFGCQWVLMNYGSLDAAMKMYTGRFLESSFNVKPDALRNIPVTYTAPPPQDPAVSFQPKRIVSPMFDYTIGSVV